jgi:ElaB/YqjD/DUF883 family membrane-anchored ribosome-binding protein
MAEQDTVNPSSDEPMIDTSAHKRNVQDAQAALAREFQTLVQDAERLLKCTQDAAGAHTEEIRTRISDNIARAKAMFDDKQGTFCEQGRANLETAEAYVQTNPWQAVGIAAGIGFLAGLLFRR